MEMKYTWINIFVYKYRVICNQLIFPTYLKTKRKECYTSIRIHLVMQIQVAQIYTFINYYIISLYVYFYQLRGGVYAW